MFGNLEKDEDWDEHSTLSFDDFKYIFSKHADGEQANHFERIRKKIQNAVKDENRDEHPTDNIFYSESVDFVIYFLAGFICKTMIRTTKCQCIAFLHSRTPQVLLESMSDLTCLKSRGGLNHPATKMFNVCKNLEAAPRQHITSVDVFDESIVTFFSTGENNLSFFPCQEHVENILSKTVLFYITMRVKQYYKQEGLKQDSILLYKQIHL